MKVFKLSLKGVFLISLVVILMSSIALAIPTASEPGFKVDLFASGLDGPFGIVFDNQGNLYVANEGVPGLNTYPGTTISKITQDGETTAFASGFEGPAGLAFDGQGNLYVSDDSGSVYKVTPEGDKTVFAQGLGNPNAICFDKNWNLFVADHYNSQIYKITPQGNISIFATGFDGPQALAFDDEGNLYTSDETGMVFKITPEGNVSLFATLPGSTQGGLILDSNGNIYASSIDLNVYKISPEGEVTPFVTGFTVNWKIFNIPRGLNFDDQGSLYITEFGMGFIWKVSPVLSVKIDIKPETLNLSDKGVFTAFITLPEGCGYALSDIDTATLVCMGAKVKSTNIAGKKLVAKFNTQDLVGVPTGNSVTLTVKGDFNDGIPLEGSDTIQVIKNKK
jgi:glucose/arabinose dehydrogenase